MDHSYKCKICGDHNSSAFAGDIKDWEYGFEGSYQYRKCSKCASIQIHPFPSVDELVESYKVDYHGFAPPMQKGAIYSLLFKINDWVADKEIRKVVSSESSVLDVGCGIGLFLKKLRSKGVRKIEGIDFSEKAVDVLNENGIPCHYGTFKDFEKDDHSYDLITMNNYLEHTMDPLAELKKARRLLKDKGKLIGEVPNFGSLDRMLFGRYWGGNHVPRHTFQFDADTLRALMKEAGFRKVSFKYPLNTSHFALSIQNMLQRNRPDLRNNANLVHGRSRYYSFCMIGLLPLNVFCALFKKTGSMKFCASV